MARKTRQQGGGEQRAVYRQEGHEVVAEPIPDMLAVRYRPEAKEPVIQGLSRTCELTVVEPQRLVVVKLPASAERESVRARLRAWQDEGLVEFVTPVLRDRESDLAQIVTDEITVRFKPNLPPQQREEMERKYNVTVARQNEFVPNQYVLRVVEPEGLKTLEVASELDSEADVEFATPNFVSQHSR